MTKSQLYTSIRQERSTSSGSRPNAKRNPLSSMGLGLSKDVYGRFLTARTCDSRYTTTSLMHPSPATSRQKLQMKPDGFGGSGLSLRDWFGATQRPVSPHRLGTFAKSMRCLLLLLALTVRRGVHYGMWSVPRGRNAGFSKVCLLGRQLFSLLHQRSTRTRRNVARHSQRSGKEWRIQNHHLNALCH